VPNFSIGANLMMHCAGLAARLMRSPTIVERHHQGKADAPSGTARLTAARIAPAIDGPNDGDGAPSTADSFREQLPGVMGGQHEGVAVHSVRGAGYLAEQEVSFSLPGETLRIEHRSIDRRCFMPGVEYAIRNIGRVTGLQIGLDTIFDL
jgi:4-hydroxy-tetrahydrodipicolinate reductase